MKLTQLSTTTKLYLLTLLLIFGILFVNQSVFAQESKSTTSEKRLKIMERYLGWIETGEYGAFKNNLGNKVQQNFKTFLSKIVAEDKACLNPAGSGPTFVENIQNLHGRAQTGEESFYPKRTAKDSELDVTKSIAEQFNLLRVVDNERYPAFFRYNNNTYIIKIKKKPNQ